MNHVLDVFHRAPIIDLRLGTSRNDWGHRGDDMARDIRVARDLAQNSMMTLYKIVYTRHTKSRNLVYLVHCCTLTVQTSRNICCCLNKNKSAFLCVFSDILQFILVSLCLNSST